MRQRQVSIILIAAALIVSCSKDSTGPAGSEIGSYILQSVDGEPLPVTGTDGVAIVKVISGSVTLGEGRLFEMVLNLQIGLSTITPITFLDHRVADSGTYTRSGKSINAISEVGESFGFLLDGQDLVYRPEGHVWRFRR